MRFRAFGLTWESRVELPFAANTDGDGPADVSMTVRTDLPLDPACQTLDRTLERRPDGWRLRFTGTKGEWLDYVFLASRGELHVSTSRRADQIWAALEGLVPAIILSNAGASLLHGSVIVRGGGAVAILGASGMGKSTLTAHLCARGAALLTDDLIAFDPHDPARVLAGSPRVGLLADAADSLGADALARDGQRMAPDAHDDKHLFRGAEVPPRSAPLSAIIALHPFAGCAPELTPLVGAAALAALRANSYGDWINLPGRENAHHWLELMRCVPVYALSRPRDLARISESCALVEALID